MNPFDWRGPEFLFFYIVLSLIVMIVSWLLRKMLDGGESAAMQSPSSLVSDPYLIAHLRGGKEETVRVAAMSLIDRRLLEVDIDGKVKTADKVRSEHGRRKIERAILEYCENGKTISRLSSLKGATDEYDEKLRGLGLMPDGATRFKRSLLFLVMLAVVGGAGVKKILIGLDRGRPVGFLILLTIFSVLILWNVVHAHRTSHGDRFLTNVKRLFAGLKDRAGSLRPGGSTADLALLAAVFGITMVPESVFPYRAQFYPTNTSSSGSSSSCSSSSCGGGGGCGGGGCGGCGS